MDEKRLQRRLLALQQELRELRPRSKRERLEKLCVLALTNLDLRMVYVLDAQLSALDAMERAGIPPAPGGLDPELLPKEGDA